MATVYPVTISFLPHASWLESVHFSCIPEMMKIVYVNENLGLLNFEPTNFWHYMSDRSRKNSPVEWSSKVPTNFGQ